tara:strand:- start:310 stop:519 length:210 start_codon:yes stop_codon:yes gene_type:complete
MTRKDFQLIADVVASTMSVVKPEARQCLALDFANALTATNPRFNVSQFVKACLVNELAETTTSEIPVVR